MFNRDAFEAAIGSRNKEYYVELHEQFQSEGLPLVKLNWMALLFGVGWFAYRKIWYFLTPYLLIVLAFEFGLPGREFFVAVLGLFVIERIIGFLFGHQIYFLWLSGEFSRLKRSGKSHDEIVQLFQKKAPSMFGGD